MFITSSTGKQQLVSGNAPNAGNGFPVLDDEGNIGISEDIFIPALTFDVFWEEFIVIPLAIKYFWETIIPSLGEARKPGRTDWIYV